MLVEIPDLLRLIRTPGSNRSERRKQPGTGGAGPENSTPAKTGGPAGDGYLLHILEVRILPKQRFESLFVFFVVPKSVDIYSVVNN